MVTKRKLYKQGFVSKDKMLTVKSKSEGNVRYLFESRVPPVSAEELAQGQHIGTHGTLEATLNLSRVHSPIDQEEYGAWKRIMKDCADPSLKAVYDDSYDAMMRYLSRVGVDGTTYRIHTVRTQG